MTVAELRALLEKAPDHYNVYLSAWNSAGDYVSGDVKALVLTREGDVVFSNEEWSPLDVNQNNAVILT